MASWLTESALRAAHWPELSDYGNSIYTCEWISPSSESKYNAAAEAAVYEHSDVSLRSSVPFIRWSDRRSLSDCHVVASLIDATRKRKRKYFIKIKYIACTLFKLQQPPSPPTVSINISSTNHGPQKSLWNQWSGAGYTPNKWRQTGHTSWIGKILYT